MNRVKVSNDIDHVQRANHRKIIRNIILCQMLVVLAEPDLGWATAGGPDFFTVNGVKTGDLLFIREKPDFNSRKVGSLPPGIRGIANLGCIGAAKENLSTDGDLMSGPKWCRISIGGFQGWAASRFLAEDSTILQIYSVSGSPNGLSRLVSTSYISEKEDLDSGRWRVRTQTAVTGSIGPDVPNGVDTHVNLVDCRPARAEIIALESGYRSHGYSTQITIDANKAYKPPLGNFDDYNLWWAICRGELKRYQY